MTFERNVKLDTGRKLAISAVSRPAFLRSGDTVACFWQMTATERDVDHGRHIWCKVNVVAYQEGRW